jgi:uncharacterized protein YdbL (DUF1318 family)
MSERVRVTWARPDSDIDELKGAGPVGERVMAYLVDVERALGEARGLAQTLKVENAELARDLAQVHRAQTIDDRVKITVDNVRQALGEIARVFVEAGLLTRLPELPDESRQWVAAVEIGPNIEMFEVTAVDRADAYEQVCQLVGEDNYARMTKFTINPLPIETRP